MLLSSVCKIAKMAQGGVEMPKLNWANADQKSAFQEWKTMMSSYFVIRKVPDAEKWHYILMSSGSDGHKLWGPWQLTDGEKANPAVVWKKFEDHLVGVQNKWVSRLELSALMQKNDENIDNFICRLRAKAQDCSFSTDDLRDEQITFQLIKGVRWKEARRLMIAKGNNLLLKDAITICQSHQSTTNSTKSFADPENVEVNEFSGRRGRRSTCRFCGTYHPPRNCPAFGKTCDTCGKQNHLPAMCFMAKNNGRSMSRQRSTSRQRANSGRRKKDNKDVKPNDSKKKETKRNEKKIQFLDMDPEYLDCGSLVIGGIERQSVFAKLDVKHPSVERVTLRVKVDTGANGNVLPLRCVRQLYGKDMPKFEKSDARLTAVNGTTLPQLGHIFLCVKFENSDWLQLKFFVCDIDGPAILSCNASEKLSIVNFVESPNISVVASQQSVVSNRPNVCIENCQMLQDVYPECFKGIGHLPGKFHIDLKPGAEPVIAAPRKYPVQLRDEICEKLSDMEKLGVIKKCNDAEPSEWLNSLAFSRKSSGELRICLDPKYLNDSIKRTYHKTPTLEEISHKLCSAKIFTKLDAKHGYWSIELDDHSSHLCSFQSPNGKYRFLRLPFGLSVSQDIFQKHMDDIINKAGPGVIGIADDLVVFGSDEREHDEALHRVMQTIKQFGLILRADKCKVKQSSVSFYGLVWSGDGVRPDPNKCDEIQNRPAPTCVSELQSFLGLMQYMSQFVPRLSDKTNVLRQLCRKGVEWTWDAEHQAAFSEMKGLINADLELRHFDPSLPTEIEVDASMKGLGAALIQLGKPVAFASKALTPVESRYANIEREMLAVVFGLEKFHTYVYGKPVLISSDHKPLESIKLKQLSKAPPRLQRMLLRIQPYEIRLVYKPGKDMAYADYLSRVKPRVGPEIELDKTIHVIQISPGQLQKVRDASKVDDEISALNEQIRVGWPDDAKLVPKLIRNYWTIRDFLSIEDGVVFYGTRLVVPTGMRKEYLDRVHASHLGQTKCLLRAKESVYWPDMTSQIVQLVKDCTVCLQHARSNVKEPMMGHEIPSQPWEVLHSDYFELKHGQKYILIVDQFSKMPFVRAAKEETSKEAIKFCKDLFSVHGIPKTFYSDNGPQYSAADFRNFALEWDFAHITSSPRYPQSNGFIERMVGIVKPILTKAQESGTDPQLALLCLRSTPIDNDICSPSELLYNRKILSNLPVKSVFNNVWSNARSKFLDKSEKSVKQYDQHAGPELSSLLPGMKVLIQKDDKKGWVPGVIKEKCIEPRSYMVQTPNGRVLRRNRRFLQELSPNAAAKLTFSNAEQPISSGVNAESVKETNQIDKAKQVQFKDTAKVVSIGDNIPPRRSGRTAAKPTRFIEEYSVFIKE